MLWEMNDAFLITLGSAGWMKSVVSGIPGLLFWVCYQATVS